MKIPVTNNLKVAYVEIIDSEYNETATIGNKDVYAYDQNDNLLCVSKLKNYFSPRQLHKIADSLKRGGQIGGSTMCKFYNGKEITVDNLKAEILDYTNNLNNPQDDLSEETRKIFEKMVAGYPGVDDDIEFIVDKLREDNLTQANLQDVEDVLKLGGFDFEK